ncbi:MAG: phosphate ABC transporter permease PstA [Thaumarchaeota archaeon]|nr:phosphate ABC transporter permease PstA [Candidatus Calditenuaceae archaeon]MDW8186668.1 phosphate ABC transporter permease PstA [Nitrososphaerota archaeon]
MGDQILIRDQVDRRRSDLKRWLDRIVPVVLSVGVFFGVTVLAALVVDVVLEGSHRLSLNLITNYPSANPAEAGMRSAILGTIATVGLSAVICIPLSIASAIYLIEYAAGKRWAEVLRYNIANLAGVPSVVFGVVGLGFLVYGLGVGRSVLAGAFTLAILTLPYVTVTCVEAIKTVPEDLKFGAYALGATRFQVVRSIILPRALPMMLTGGILGISRAIGEAAPILVISGLLFIREDPTSLFDRFTVMPLQLFNWISRPQPAFRELSAAGIIVLLLILLALNSLVIYMRYRLYRRLEAT